MTEEPSLHSRTPQRSRAAAALAVVALLVALLALRVVNVSRAEIIARDGCVYLQMAKDFSRLPAGEVLKHYEYHPGYSGLIHLAARALHVDWPVGWEQVGLGLSVFFSLVGLLAVYLVARRAFDHRIAWITMLIVGLSSTWMEVSCDVLSDALAVSLAAMGIALGLEARRAVARQSGWSLVLAAGAAVCSGGAYLTRPEGLLAAAVAAVLLIRAPHPPCRRARRLQLASLGILIALTAALCLPYMLAIGGITAKKGLSDFTAVPTGGLPLASAQMPADLLSALRRGVDRLRAAAGTPMAVLMIVCLATWIGRYWLRLKLPERVVLTPRSPSPAVAMFVPLGVLFPLLVALEYNLGSPEQGYISSRHMLLPALMLSPLAGAGVAILVQWSLHLGRRAGLVERPRLAWTCWTLGIACVLAVEAFPVLHEGKRCHVRAGRTVLRQFGPGRRVLAPSSWVPFYAQATPRQFRQVDGLAAYITAEHLRDLDRLAQLIRRGQPRNDSFVAVTQSLLEDTDRPDETLRQLRTHPNLTPLGAFPSPDEKVWLFRWQSDPPAATQPHGR
jgi:hypothetical protein